MVGQKPWECHLSFRAEGAKTHRGLAKLKQQHWCPAKNNKGNSKEMGKSLSYKIGIETNVTNNNYRMSRWKGRMEENIGELAQFNQNQWGRRKRFRKLHNSAVDFISFLPYFHPYLVPQEVFPHSFSISSETRPTRTSILLVVGYICLNQHVWTLLFFQGIIVTASISFNIKAVLLTPGV